MERRLGIEAERGGPARASVQRALAVAAAVSTGFMLVFVVAGLISNFFTSWLDRNAKYATALIGVGLVVLGLVISIPIVVWGSTLVLHWLERFPGLLYVGGAVLAWTAVKMITDEPLVRGLLAGHALLVDALYVLVIGGTLGLAWLRKRRALTAKEVLS